MEFNEKLQELRKQKGITQEELAEALYVSRTAVSKWESGRGYPNIDSLKEIARFFSVTLDELLSGDELLTIAEQDNKQKEKHIHDLVFGLLDTSALMLFFLPLFADKKGEFIQVVSLLELSYTSKYLKVVLVALVVLTTLFGIFTLAFQNCNKTFWTTFKRRVSLILNVVLLVMFIITLLPYAAVYVLLFLIIKTLMLIKFR